MSKIIYFFILSGILSIICYFICRMGYRKEHQIVKISETKTVSPSRKDIGYVLLLVTACFFALSLLLQQSWLQHDEWLFANKGNLPFLTAVHESVLRYSRWVSRIGEIGAGIVGLSLSRWQAWILTPLFASLAPVAAFALVKKSDDTLFSKKGRLFYLTAFILFLLAVYLPYWRNYWCYAAAWNYLYPSVILIYFLSFFRNDTASKKSFIRYLLAFFIGVISGWGTECATIVLLPILTCIVIFNLKSKRPWLSYKAYCSYCGFLWGAAALFCSPALYRRSAIVNSSKGIDISSLSQSDYYHFIHNLNWDKVNSLVGGSGIVSLKDIPFLDRIYFIPFLTERALSCCCVALTFWLILFLLYLCTEKKSAQRHVLLYSSAIIGIASLFALSYGVQCIPSTMSFLPAGFAVVIACMFIFIRSGNSIVKYIFSILVFLTGSIIFVPTGIQAYQHKHIEIERNNEICHARSAGNQDITLSTPSLTLWWPTLGMIGVNDIKPSSDQYPNGECSYYFGVTSLKQSRALIKKHDAVPLWIFPKIDQRRFKTEVSENH